MLVPNFRRHVGNAGGGFVGVRFVAPSWRRNIRSLSFRLKPLHEFAGQPTLSDIQFEDGATGLPISFDQTATRCQEVWLNLKRFVEPGSNNISGGWRGMASRVDQYFLDFAGIRIY